MIYRRQSCCVLHADQISSYVFAQWQQYMGPNSFQVPSAFVIPTNLSVIIFAFVYEFLLIYDELYDRNSVQITAACFINIGLIVTTVHSRLQLKNAIFSMDEARDSNDDPLVHLDIDIWGHVRGIMIAIPLFSLWAPQSYSRFCIKF
jgi:hypothetical protein